MADLKTLLANMTRDGYFMQIAQNPLSQFGTPARRYLGAELLPERNVDENAFREAGIKYRTVIANDGTRYSPTQLKRGELVGSFLVELGESDIAREFTARDYDALLKMLGTNADMAAVTQMINFVDTTVNRALVELNEKQRWDAIVASSVLRTGDNTYSEAVAYSNPTNHRTNAAAPWSTNTTDIFAEILAKADLLASKGYTVSRIFAGRTVISMMANNNTVKTRTGVATINSSGQITATAGRASVDSINGILERDGLPPIEQYDLQYRTQTGTGFFLPRNVFVMVATTGQTATVDQGDTQRVLNDTLGYLAIGRAAGQNASGRVIRAEAFDNKPPRVEAEGWQTTLPVITEPEAIGVIAAIT
jgi:hypothetical protein